MSTAASPTLELDETLKARILNLARRRKTTPTRLVEDALEFLERGEDDGEEAYYQRARRALENYRKTGLHITGEEFFDWLDKLEADPDAPLPTCHV